MMKMILGVDVASIKKKGDLPPPRITLQLDPFEFVAIQSMLQVHRATAIFEEEQDVITDFDRCFKAYKAYLEQAGKS